MKVKLNSFRGEGRPGDVVDVSDSDGATLIRHGAAFPVDDVDGQDGTQADAARTVSASAELVAASGTETPDQ